MARFNIDFEGWTTIEADSEDEAFSIAQDIISQIDELVSNHLTLAEPLELLVADNGVSLDDLEEDE